MRWAGHVARTEEKRDACRILVGKPEGKRPLRRPRHRRVDNSVTDFLKALSYGARNPIAKQRPGKHLPASAHDSKREFIANQRLGKQASSKIQTLFSVGSVQSG
jgi:hypothetical protein